MKLNCNQNDVAVIVRGVPATFCLLGKIVRVTRLTAVAGYPAWNYEGPLLRDLQGRGIPELEDCCLKPLRDLGDDATDETLLRNPVPIREWQEA